MKREEILSKIEAIQERNYNEFKGSNEADLHIREDVADMIEEILQASGVSSTNEPCDLAGVVGRSEQLVAFCRWYNQAIPSYETTEEEIVETYLRESN